MTQERRTVGKASDVIRRAFSIHNDSAGYDEIQQRILSGAEVKGTNLCVLILAIFIASIGLNMNSTAVIIGAMLISPLMGGIMAIGYGFATGDLKLARNAAIGLSIQVLVSLIVSTIYFSLTPIVKPTAELLARTKPTIWDVLIASFGGFAGIIGITRQEKSNLIPGVAIATALMPPLCTAGYGLAIHNPGYFGGALYLFLINAVFICLTTIIGLIILGVPHKRELSESQRKRITRHMIISLILFTIPSIVFAGQMVMDEVETQTEVVSSNIDSGELKTMTDELKIVHPEIESIEMGYVDTYDGKALSEKLLVTIHTSKKIDEESKDVIKKLVEYRFNHAEVRFN